MRKKGLFITLILMAASLLANTAVGCSSWPTAFPMFYAQLDTTFHHEISEREIFEKGDVFPITVGSSCAFAMAGDFDEGIGSPVANLQSGLLVQTIGLTNVCSPQTNLVMVDCESAEVALLKGDGPPEEFGSTTSKHLIGHHLAPEGPINVEAANSIQEIVSAAVVNELRVFQNDEAVTHVDELFDGDQPNLFCGCKIFYPESNGANQ